MGWLFHKSNEDYHNNPKWNGEVERLLENISISAHNSNLFDEKAQLDYFLDASSRFLINSFTVQELTSYFEDHKNDMDNLADALGANDMGSPPPGYPMTRVMVTLALCVFFSLCIYGMYVFMLADLFHRVSEMTSPNMPLFCFHDKCYWIR